jgi:hypothetical protein
MCHLLLLTEVHTYPFDKKSGDKQLSKDRVADKICSIKVDKSPKVYAVKIYM